MGWVQLALIGPVLVIFILKYCRLVVNILKTFPRDATGIYRYIRMTWAIRSYQKAQWSVWDAFDSNVTKTPNKICFKFDQQEWTFKEIWQLSNQIANYFQENGFKKGDVIALFMTGRPEYVAIWLGLSQIGVVTSLINSNLRLTSLKHCLKICNPKAIIYADELASEIAQVFENLDLNETKEDDGHDLKFFSCQRTLKDDGESESEVTTKSIEKSESLEKLMKISKNLTHQLKPMDKSKPNVVNKPTFSDRLFYIYTSGTTGLPKASIIKNSKYIVGTMAFHYMIGLKKDDVIYTCLPLYHSAGAVCGVGQSLFFSCSVVLRQKFSASKFFPDCRHHGVTVAQYIGDICRFLLAQPVSVSSTEENEHKIRIMAGNGLRSEIWTEFAKRFKIPQIAELYGSTDGNCDFVNWDGRIGACGFVPILLQKIFPMRLIAVDPKTAEPIRDPDTGLAVQCQANEMGELVGKIVQSSAVQEFQGYAGGSEGVKSTKKATLNDVFSKGDQAFRTGDLLVMDDLGYFYFKDRARDSFRWKGENVSTAEVQSIITKIFNGTKEAVVYGVKVEGTEGRAGMATIADFGERDKMEDFNFEEFAQEINKYLPSYARPLFLRIKQGQIGRTETHKLKKYELQDEGFDVRKIKDPIYFYEVGNGKYRKLDEDLYTKIMEREVRM